MKWGEWVRRMRWGGGGGVTDLSLFFFWLQHDTELIDHFLL